MDNNEEKGMAPGWNDPPFLTYSSTTQPLTKRILNQRILHPDLAIKSSSNEHINGTLTPPFSTIPPNSIKASNLEAEKVQNLYEDSSENKQFIFQAIKLCLEKCHNNTQVTSPILAEINKKVNIFFKDWEDDKLNLDIKSKMYKLSQALTEGKLDEAYNIHVILMAQYAFQINNWLIAIKKMITLTKDFTTKNEGS